MQLGLHRGRVDLEHLDVTGTLGDLRPQGKDKVVQGGLGGAVVGAAHHGHEGHLGGGVGEGGLGGEGLQVGEEGLGEVDGGSVVGDELGVEGGEVDSVGVGEVEGALDAGVDEDAVQVGVGSCDLGGELGDLYSG